MNILKRMQLIRILEKIEKNIEFSRKLGIKDKSHFEDEKDKNKSMRIKYISIT